MTKKDKTFTIFLIIISVLLVWSVISIFINFSGFMSVKRVLDFQEKIASYNDSEDLIYYCENHASRNMCFYLASKIKNDTTYCKYLVDATYENISIIDYCSKIN